jgi:type IV secretion system protein TrbL
MTPDLGIMTELLEKFEAAFSGGQKQIGDFSFNILYTLCGIELALLGIYAALGGQEVVTPMLKKILTIGFYIWVVKNFPYLTGEVLSGFTQTGMVAAGNLSPSAILDPSEVLARGFEVTKVVFAYMTFASSQTYTGFSMDAIICGLTGVLILLAFFVIALQIFITRLEFALVVALGLILIPFGVFKQTAFIAEKVFGAILSFGVKLMVLTFICCIAMPIMQGYTIPEGFVWDAMFNMLFASATIACLAWHAPKITAGLLSGSPSLGGTGAITGAAALAGGYAALAKGISAAIPQAPSPGGPGGVSGGMDAMRVATGNMGISSNSSGSQQNGSSSGESSSVSEGSGAAREGSSEGNLTSARSVKEGAGGEKGGNAGANAQGSEDQSGFAAGSKSAGSTNGGGSSAENGGKAGSLSSAPSKGGAGAARGSSGRASSGSPGTESASKAGKVDEEDSKGGSKKGASKGNSSGNSSISNQASGSSLGSGSKGSGSLSSQVERSQGGSEARRDEGGGGSESSYSASALSTRSHPKGGSDRTRGISGRVRSE